MFSWYTEMVGKSVGLGQTDTRLMGFLHNGIWSYRVTIDEVGCQQRRDTELNSLEVFYYFGVGEWERRKCQGWSSSFWLGHLFTTSDLAWDTVGTSASWNSDESLIWDLEIWHFSVHFFLEVRGIISIQHIFKAYLTACPGIWSRKDLKFKVQVDEQCGSGRLIEKTWIKEWHCISQIKLSLKPPLHRDPSLNLSSP